MKKSAKLLLGAAGITGLSAGVSYALTRFFMRTALDRQPPKAVDRVSGLLMGTGSWLGEDLSRQVETGVRRLAGDPGEEVEITGFDGVRLVGHWKAPEHPRRVLVAMHGWRSDWKRDFALGSLFWEEEGCAVLYAEQRGQGQSGGDRMGFGLTERFDCADWAAWAAEKTGGELPVYLCGISLGAATVLMAGALPLPEQVRGIVADCGFTSPRAIWRHVAEHNLHLSYGLRAPYIDRVCRERFGLDTGYSTADALAENTRPVLFIHGAADTFVPVEMTYENYAACKAPKELLIVPGAGHGLSYWVEPDRYKRAVRDFWRRYDGD